MNIKIKPLTISLMLLILESINMACACEAIKEGEKTPTDRETATRPLTKRALCVPKGWDSYISCEFSELHCELEKLGWEKLIIDEISDELILMSMTKFDVVLLFEAYEFLERNKTEFSNNRVLNSIKKVFFCDDIHFFSRQFKQLRLSAFNWADLILATYPEKLVQLFPEIYKEKVIWAPHSAASCFYPKFSPSINKLLLSGSRSWAYPFRQLCEQTIPREICDVIDHPGYRGYPGNNYIKVIGKTELIEKYGRENYGDLLRSYPAMLVCGSVLNYLVAKVFEGMASGCLVICDRDSLEPQLTQLKFIEGVHYIGTDILHVKEDSIKVHEIFIKNRDLWKTIVESAFEKVKNEHTVPIRAKQIDKIIDSFFRQ